MIDIKEIFVANGSSAFMMWFLLMCRRRNRESIHIEDKIFDGMAFVNFLGAVTETLSFLIDGRSLPGGRLLNYVSNSLCYLGTASIGLLWCLYVNLRVYRNYKRMRHCLRFVLLPWLVESLMLLANLTGRGLVFRITEDNVYQRCPSGIFSYAVLLYYLVYSVQLVERSRKEGIHLDFFPVMYFAGPCLAGVLIQMAFYGITTCWLSVSIALSFVQMQTYAENLYMDELSGLYNRRYMNRMLADRSASDHAPDGFYGIMMDMNDFKSINDSFGHSAGDRAICRIGDILFRSIPEGGIAVRFAGDEFIVLLPHTEERSVHFTMEDIRKNMEAFNAAGTEPFHLSVSMGYARFEPAEDPESFLKRMDACMYEEKRLYHRHKRT